MERKDKLEIGWMAPEFEYREKDVFWHILTVILALILLGVAVWQKNFLFGVFIVIAEILILVWGERRPRTITFKINERGLEVDGRKLYRHSEIESFSLSDFPESDLQDVLISFKQSLKPILKIKVSAEEARDVERIAKNFIRKTDHEPSLVDALENFFWF